MKQAIVATEDKRFYEHRGVDIRGMARASGPTSAARRGPGRLDDHAAVRQERVPDERSRRSRRKLKEAALAWQLEQKWTKDRILTAYLNTDLLRERRVRRRAGVAHLLRAQRGEADARRGGAARRHPRGPEPVRPRRASRRAAKARRTLVLRLMLQQHVHHAAASTARSLRADAEAAETCTSRASRAQAPYFAKYVKRSARRPVRRRARSSAAGCRVQTTIDLRLQKLARDAIASRAAEPPTGRRPRSSRSTRERPARCSRWSAAQLPREPVQPRDAGRAAAGLGVQAVRARDRAEGGHLAADDLTSSKPVSIYPGGKYWHVHNYEGEYLGPIDLVEGDRRLRQLRLLAADGDRRPDERRDDGASARASRRRCRATSRSASAREPATPLEMARAYATFANGGNRIDGSVFGNAAARRRRRSTARRARRRQRTRR